MRSVKKNGIILSASVSCFDLYDLKPQFEEAGQADIAFLHYDVVDGSFNNCIILGTPLLEAIRPHTQLPIEVHLAVYHPEKYIEAFVKAGADYIAVHYEAMEKPLDVFEKIVKHGAIPVLALKSTTPFCRELLELAKVVPWILKLTVDPGYAGQKMQLQAIEHIRELRHALTEEGLSTGIQADGNINLNTIPQVVEAGADILTGGTSGLFLKGESIKNNALNMLDKAQASAMLYAKQSTL